MTVQGLVDDEQVWPPLDVTVYPVMIEPPLEEGAVQATVDGSLGGGQCQRRAWCRLGPAATATVRQLRAALPDSDRPAIEVKL